MLGRVIVVAATLVLAACSAQEQEESSHLAGDMSSALSMPADPEDDDATESRDRALADAESLPGFVGVVVEGPGFSVELPVDGDLFSVGFHAEYPDEQAGALLSDSQFGSVVIVWQAGHSEPAEAIASAYQRLDQRGLDAAPDATVEFTISDGMSSDHGIAAENVTLRSTFGEATGIAVVWTCNSPDRTFAMMVYDGDYHAQYGLAQTVLASFDCTPAE